MIVRCLFLLPLKIDKRIKEKLLKFGPENAKLTRFSKVQCQRPGGVWDKLLAKFIKVRCGIHRPTAQELEDVNTDQELVEAAQDLISSIEKQHDICFFDSKFPLFGFMRDVATNEKKQPKLYLWQGEADAIAYSRKLEKYVIVEFKVVDNLSDYWKKKTNLCGKHLHQCLVYANLLKRHMELNYLPPSLIVVIHKVTGNEGYFALFEDYPKKCSEKLCEYEWFTKQPFRRPLKIVNTDKLWAKNLNGYEGIFSAHIQLINIFAPNATVKDLLDALGYDSLEYFQLEE